MDPQRFDRLSKAFANGATRRGVVRGLGRGGLFAAVAGGFGTRDSARAQDASSDTEVICHYDFRAGIRLGPSSKTTPAQTLEGELALTIGADGAIDDGTLTDADQHEYAVVGQAIGRAIHLWIEIEKDIIHAVGTSKRNVRDCRGAMGGPATGPQDGDLGDWTATIKRRSTSTPTAVTESSTAPADLPPTFEPECDLECDPATSVLDATPCTCICTDPTRATSCVTEGGTPRYGECVDIDSNAHNCGGCGQACSGGPHVGKGACISSTCVYDCLPNYATCDPSEPCGTDLTFTPNHCGACETACPEPFSCSNGKCVCFATCGSGGVPNITCTGCDCYPGLTDCSGICRDLSVDPNNCGACGFQCDVQTPNCEAGECVAIAEQ